MDMELVETNLSLIARQGNNSQFREDLRQAAQDIRDEVRREVEQARDRANEARAAQAQSQGQPVNPSEPTVIVTPMPDGHQVLLGGSQVPQSYREEIPPQAVDMALAFFFTMAVIIIGLPISRAFARRMDRKAVQQVPPEVSAQLGQLSQAVDAIALEVERISEGQRFTTRLLSEQRDAARHALPAVSDR
jgi:hypothetical protein